MNQKHCSLIQSCIIGFFLNVKNQSLSMNKKKILILTQTPPSMSGQGMAMRVGNVVDGLSQNHDVTLVIVSADPSNSQEKLADYWYAHCTRICMINVAEGAARVRAARSSLVKRAFAKEAKLLSHWPIDEVVKGCEGLRGEIYDSVIVVALRLMPVWRAMKTFLGVRAQQNIFDLNDIDSISNARQVRILGMEHLGKFGFILEWFESKKLARAEAQAVQEMDRILICSEIDKKKLEKRFRSDKIHVLPNTIRVPILLPSPIRSNTLRLLFVGTLSYTPNEDAVRWLVNELLPEMKRRLAPLFVCLDVVGQRPPTWMKEKSNSGLFNLFADVPDVMPYYAECDVVVVPIRSGGGTRIKILEAFGYGRVVLSTSLGAEGIMALDGDELLLAENASEFSDALLRLSSEPGLSSRLIQNARNRVVGQYSLSSCTEALEKVLAS
jgi:glycosyltransferase involved in cell wall biosynthesis